MPGTKAEELVDRLTGEDLLPALAACRLAGLQELSQWTVIRLCRDQKLEALKVGGRWLSTVPAVQRYLMRCAGGA